MYIWHNVDNYFEERVDAGFEETQSDDQAPALFLANTRYLLGLGVNVPQVLYADILDSGHHFALVERVIGTDLDKFSANATEAERHTVLNRLNDQLLKLHAVTRTYPGSPQAEPDDQRHPPQDRTLARAFLEVDATAEAQPTVADYRQPIRDRLRALHAEIAPRSTYHLIHGELAGGHILIRAGDHAVYLVDIEGLHFNDLEAEHTFVKWVYSAADYQPLARADLDPTRMAFYKFAMHVSLVYAGSCFMRRGFYDQPWAERMFKRNLSEVLNTL
jgi:aminoglycoside phosphotransferase (APT) family kinase protein